LGLNCIDEYGRVAALQPVQQAGYFTVQFNNFNSGQRDARQQSRHRQPCPIVTPKVIPNPYDNCPHADSQENCANLTTCNYTFDNNEKLIDGTI
jgi:hypothetical protein